MIVWIERPLAIAIHERQLAEHGGGIGVRDDNLLDSALARPRQSHAYGDPPPDLADLAASLAFGLARNHPFVDGNKRTAHVCYRVFLSLNDADLVASDEEKYVAMIALAEGSLSETGFATWLRQHIKLGGKKRVNEPRARYAR
ncbi:death-on-curing protein [Rhodanobacter thiooxydans]|uniref:Death-on-curing protein n=1 Tax=Rhodanobacter thiooxydans TaxID=416169 RepID=A0A154QJR3_9GAMM|nr:type II toxin-antitoxin system death-on-curing family toxin [Rhodanobacter thiooxydans]EIM02339.1 death-on-curing protein [Rhodanobacter thiooxydans LCS2]KZC24404.1 death-on-curing protein [Rhodanobacter thiooxydans]MCW0200778.1 type II toxin-antitoxin system death-on-curing family toxin [Rhodanobacter thiooxydans]